MAGLLGASDLFDVFFIIHRMYYISLSCNMREIIQIAFLVGIKEL